MIIAHEDTYYDTNLDGYINIIGKDKIISITPTENGWTIAYIKEEEE